MVPIMMQCLVNLQASPHAMLAWTVKSVKEWIKLRGKLLEDQQLHAATSTRVNNLGTLGGFGSLIYKDQFTMSREIEEVFVHPSNSSIKHLLQALGFVDLLFLDQPLQVICMYSLIWEVSQLLHYLS